MIGRKVLAVAVILLFIGMSIPSTGTVVEKKFSMPTNYDGNTLYVGGDGQGNYTKIQDAIDNASDGDTIYVFNGTYYENIVIDKSMQLTGEKKETTIIDSNGSGDAVDISADSVTLSGFTIQNAGRGIRLSWCNGYTLSNNIITSNSFGISSAYCSYNTISENIVSNNENGAISLQDLKDSTISGNIVTNNGGRGISIYSRSYSNLIFDNIVVGNGNGIGLSEASNNIVSSNTITSNSVDGIYLQFSSGNIINKNDIKDTDYYGISVGLSSDNNTFYHNNFKNNTQNAYDKCNNSWYTDYLQGGNFWSDYAGNDYYRGVNQDIPGSDGIGDTPYNISGPGNNTDRYPLMNPYGCPFQTLYLGYVDVHFEKEAILSGSGGYGGVLKAIYLNVNTSLDELPLTMVYHYTIEMNYSLRFPFWFAPLVAIGLKIKNYSDYSWGSIKLLHHGQGIWYGNVTQDINLNLTGFEKGDELELTVDISVIRVPSLDTPGNNELWEWFLRLIYNIPVLKDTLLHKWLLPILAPYNLLFDSPAIFLRFQ